MFDAYLVDLLAEKDVLTDGHTDRQMDGQTDRELGPINHWDQSLIDVLLLIVTNQIEQLSFIS